jgi:hypothetical protein
MPCFVTLYFGFDQGAVRMYTPGYMPNTIATIDGLKSYRNDASGIFVHKCYNIIITNGFFADNNIGVDIDRAQGVVVRDTVIIGESDSYRKLMARQTVAEVCRQGRLKGLDLFTWKLDKERGAVTVTNVDISGFSNVACDSPSSIHMDDMVGLILARSPV